jgi:hypothetical protein
MEQTTLFIVVVGLLVLTLVLASIMQRYNDYIQERNQQVQRILNRIGEIESLIQRIPGLPVPVEAEVLLRKDVLARLQALKQIHPKYAGIAPMIQEAERVIAQVKPQPQDTNLDTLRLEQLSRLLKEIHWLLEEQRLLTPLTDDDRARLMAALDLRRTECLYRHHIQEAERLEKAHQLHQASWHCSQLKSLIEPLRQSHQQASEWQQRIQQVCGKVSSSLQGSNQSGEPSSV